MSNESNVLGAYSTIDLSTMPEPAVIENLDYEIILAGEVADLRLRAPLYTAIVESDPAFKLLEVSGYREFILRNRVNEAARSTMLAYAIDQDLEHIAARKNIKRHLVSAEDLNAVPAVAAVYESNDSFRHRIQLSPEGVSTAGPSGSYRFHALSADPQVLDAGVYSPAGGHVVISVLSRTGNGLASAELVAAVDQVVQSGGIKPLTDITRTVAAEIIEYQVEAVIDLLPGAGGQLVLASAEQAVIDYVAKRHRVGLLVARSGIYAALHQAGVKNVDLIQPPADIEIGDSEAGYCTAINISEV